MEYLQGSQGSMNDKVTVASLDDSSTISGEQLARAIINLTVNCSGSQRERYTSSWEVVCQALRPERQVCYRLPRNIKDDCSSRPIHIDRLFEGRYLVNAVDSRIAYRLYDGAV